MLAEFSIFPLGKGESISDLVSKAVEIVHKSGIDYRMHPMGTVIEGEWDEVFELLKKCHMAVKSEAGRVITTISIDDRDVSGPRADKKIKSVEKKLGHKLKI